MRKLKIYQNFTIILIINIYKVQRLCIFVLSLTSRQRVTVEITLEFRIEFRKFEFQTKNK